MKRLLSLVLALCMLAALLPATLVSASAAEPSGITVKYDVGPFCKDADQTQRFDAINFDSTYGLVSYAGNYWSVDFPNPSALSRCKYHDGNLQIASPGFFGFKIFVPKAGEYSIEALCGEYAKGGNTDVYFSSVTCRKSTAELVGSYSIVEPSKTVATFPTCETPKVVKNSSGETAKITVEAPGYYYITFGNQGAYGSVGTFWLVGGDGKELIAPSVTIDKKLLDEEAQTKINTKVIYSDATEATDAEITYESLTPSIASVDSNGTVTGIAEGDAKVRVTAKVGEVTKSSEIEFKVQKVEYCGVVVKYNLVEGEDFKFENNDNVKNLTFKDTDGFWSYEGDDGAGEIVQINDSFGIEAKTESAEQWFALRVKVPFAGAYRMEMDYAKAESGCCGGVWILPGDTEDIGAALTGNTTAGKVDYYTDSKEPVAANKAIGNVKIPAAGEYIIAFRPIDNSTGGEKKNMFIGDITFNGGEEKVLMSPVITPSVENTDVGGTINLTADVYFSDDTAADAEITFESLTPDIATVSASGEVTGIASGEAKIRATAELSGKSTSSDISLPILSDNTPRHYGGLRHNPRRGRPDRVERHHLCRH